MTSQMKTTLLRLGALREALERLRTRQHITARHRSSGRANAWTEVRLQRLILLLRQRLVAEAARTGLTAAVLGPRLSFVTVSTRQTSRSRPFQALSRPRATHH